MSGLDEVRWLNFSVIQGDLRVLGGRVEIGGFGEGEDWDNEAFG